ncbi:MAG: peroxiredoxin family protein [Planctomycetota bacterium]
MVKEIKLPLGVSRLTHDVTEVKLLGVFAGGDAPEFEATTLDDAKLKLSDFRGKLVLIDFWATWCSPCIAELPNVKKAYEKFADAGFVVISVSFDKDAATARKFANKKKMTWPQVWVKGGNQSRLAELYGVAGIPATFLVGPDGKVVTKDLRGEKLITTVAREINKPKPLQPPAKSETP